MPDLVAMAEKLRARRAELEGEIAKIADELDDPVPKDWEDSASERQGDEVLEALGSHDAAEMRQIDAALARIEDGSYGYCVRCGSEISAERLAVVPATPVCRTCARQI
ncbi:TraR/DksA family transcriptional regulator [Aestuariibius sp. 2305UL40-4]|uniref:TraR/DksA family transcriptional regulator n=1 Tax=Aestuariibius violaceus TaxID=3234132 RepID=UPI00345E65E0